MTPLPAVTPERVRAARVEIERRKAFSENAANASTDVWRVQDGGETWQVIGSVGHGWHESIADTSSDDPFVAEHIAACDPPFMLRVYDGHLGVLERHEVIDLGAAAGDWIVCSVCREVSDPPSHSGLVARYVSTEAPCPDLAAVLDIYAPSPVRETVTAGGDRP